MRRDWAAAWARALRPGAELVCLAFPIGGKDGVETGPPWPVQPQQYKDLLLPQGEGGRNSGNAVSFLHARCCVPPLVADATCSPLMSVALPPPLPCYRL